MIDPSEALKETALPRGVEAEIFCEEKQSRSVAWADGKPSLQENSISEGMCVRVLADQRQGLLTTRSFDLRRISRLAARALASARATQPDPYLRFGRPQGRSMPALRIDEKIFSRSLDDQLNILSDLEKAILRVDGRVKKVVKLAISEHRWRNCLDNSHGNRASSESSVTSVAVEVLAEDDWQTEVAWDYQSHRFSQSLPFMSIAESVGRRAAYALGGKPLPSGKYTVVLEPRVGAQLLEIAADALSAEAIQRGRSFFAGQLGQMVASPVVTLVDDPLLSDGVASTPCDDEGTPHEKLTMVAAGELKDFFYDLRSASKDQRESNGRGIKESLGLLPRPASTNFFMEPGTSKPADMLASDSKVFLLKEVMGLHMADPITGEFSLGASGALYENGRLSRPVRGVTIASDIAQMLRGIAAVGDDLTWYGSTGSPSILLPNVTIAGN